MAPFDGQGGPRVGGPSVGATGTNDLQGSALSPVDGCFGQSLPRGSVAEFILGAPPGSVITLSGIAGEDLRGLLDQVEP
jgi:hypothetical protein